MAEFERLTLDGIDYEYWFCDDCEHYGEPNGCNRKEGECNQHHVFVEYANRLREYEQSGLSPEQVKAIADAQTWISVKDRLPKTMYNKVIVRCENKYIGFGHYEKHNGTEEWFNLETSEPFCAWNLDRCDTYTVTHWLPLPEQPKEE